MIVSETTPPSVSVMVVGENEMLHVVYDDPEMTDEEAGVLARVLARFGLDGSDPDAIAKLDIATRRLEGAIEHPALPEPTTAHHGDGDERTDSDAAGNEPEP